MRTSKPISTICYNTKEFLIDTLERLKLLRFISYYEFIVHLGDTDDKKQHIHLYFEPAKVIDTESIKTYFVENDPLNPDKPFVIHDIRNSKFGDWYWYVLHDVDYLKSKMLTRNIHYNDSDIYSSDMITHNYKVIENPLCNYCFLGDLAIREQIFNAVNNGIPLNELLYQIKVPLGKIQSVIHFYNALLPYYSPKNEDIKSKHVMPTLEQTKGMIKNIAQQKTLQVCNQIALGQAVATDYDPIF